MTYLDRERGQGFLGFLLRLQSIAGTEAAGRSVVDPPPVAGHSFVRRPGAKPH
jgi:hypothetical protein